MPKYAKKRDKSEKEIVEALRQGGASVWPMDTPCDLLVGFAGGNYLVECKTRKSEGGKDEFTDLQEKFLDEWRGQRFHVLRSKQEAIDFLNKVRRCAIDDWYFQ